VKLLACTAALSIIGLLPLPIARPRQESQGHNRSSPSRVWLNAIVVDPHGNPVNNLRQDQFRVIEDGVPQVISFFANNESPLVCGLAVDTSGSLRAQFETVIKAAKLVIAEKRPDDKMLLMRFTGSDNIDVVQDFTTDQSALRKSLDELYVASGQSSIIDAVSFANSRISAYTNGQEQIAHSLVLITDGVEQSSYYREDTLIAKLSDGDLRIFVIGLLNGVNNSREHDKAVNLLKLLASVTGGDFSFPDSPAALEPAVRQTMRQVRLGYRLGYLSTNQARDGTWRSIRIEIVQPPGSEKVIVRARPGYFARKN
jgi:Ca-activated chloride channel family protein